ncbi:MAG: SDR family oxidoreductase [Gammaproteobacteria bacterium]|nr:SDR family oxidoreductase [Gammaproteobacteria bacterium]
MLRHPVFIAGCGDIGRRVAAIHRPRGDSVSALARTQASALRLTAPGVTPLAGDLDQANFPGRLPLRGAQIYYFVPPPEAGGHDPRIARFLASIDAAPAKLVYISTSGVYGDHHGGWVTEDTPPNPQTARARVRLAAENILLDWSRRARAPVVILRVGGIYGPGRLPIERIRRAEPVVRREEAAYTNRIHADDLARVCMAAMEHGSGIYNVCDGEHGAMTDYFNAVADALGLPRPPQISLAEAQARLSPGMVSYLNESRRMDNRRMREELGVTLLYPTLEQGLKFCAADTAPG